MLTPAHVLLLRLWVWFSPGRAWMFPHYLPWGEAKQLPAAVADSPCMNESCIDLPYVSLFKGPIFFPHVFFIIIWGEWVRAAHLVASAQRQGQQKWS